MVYPARIVDVATEVKVTVPFTFAVIESKGPEVAKVKALPFAETPWAEMVAVAGATFRYPESLLNCEMEVVLNPMAPVDEIARPVPSWNVFEAVPPIVILEVVMYPLSFENALRLFGKLIVTWPDEVEIENAFDEEDRLNVNAGPTT